MTEKEIRRKIANNLVAIRKIKGLTRRSAAEQIGISYTYLTQLEDERIDKSLSNEWLSKIAEFYEIEPYMLYK